MNKYNFLQYFYIVFLFFCLGLGIVKQGQSAGNLNNNKEALINNKGNSFRAVAVSYQAMSIHDGDTLRVVDNKGEELKVRFACIDASEISQPFGKTARDHLRELLILHDYQVRLNIVTTDRFGRNVAEVYLPNGSLVQEIQAREGMVFAYDRFKSNCPSWEKIEAAVGFAKSQVKGVWENNQEAPWDYRRRRGVLGSIERSRK